MCFLPHMTLYLLIVKHLRPEKSKSHKNLQPVITCTHSVKGSLLSLGVQIAIVWTSFNLHTSYCLLAYSHIKRLVFQSAILI